jgi:hypothetical protein
VGCGEFDEPLAAMRNKLSAGLPYRLRMLGNFPSIRPQFALLVENQLTFRALYQPGIHLDQLMRMNVV